MTPTLLLALLLGAQSGPADSLKSRILERIAHDSGATIAVAARDPVGGFLVLVNPDLRFHAASTMKVPVLVELARQVDPTPSIPVATATRPSTPQSDRWGRSGDWPSA